MGLDDFCRCTPAEFSAIARRWMEMRQQQRREQWEQTRMTCLCLLQPYSKKKLTPRDVMRFDWDNEPKETHEEEQTREQLTTEEIKRRYREAMRKWKGTYNSSPQMTQAEKRHTPQQKIKR